MDLAVASEPLLETSRSDLAELRARLIADPAFQARLGALYDPSVFVATACGIAAELGLAVTADDIADELAVARSRRTPPVMLGHWPAQGWLPAKWVSENGSPAIDWAWFGPEPLREPFFEDSLRRVRVPLNSMLGTRTSLQALVDGAAAEPCVPPNGFIFHMSRCGSTLVAQMLAAVDHHIVLAEPPPLDAVLQWLPASGLSLEDQLPVLRAMVSALARNRSGDARRCFVKLDSWHVLSLPLIRAAFPDVPWIFLYREPLEVLVSHMRRPGMHAIPGGGVPAHLFGIAGVETMLPAEYCARVLAAIFDAVLDHGTGERGMLVNYAELPQAAGSRVAAHFGFRPDAREGATMAAAGARDAKSPDLGFSPDSTEKREAASPEARQYADRLLRSPYERLEALRLAQVEAR